MRLAVTVFRLTAEFPADEKFGISSQLRRSAISVPSNIAEGSARGSRAELRRFLLIARGSLSELDTQLWLAREVGLVEDIGPIQERMYKVFGLLNGLMKSPGSKV
ncbi:MAG: four helix bundle protein [Rhodanobacteraceae bacterium]|nr:four helix bundle protein [Xanthomonadales bacterium]MCP5477131.1 four helix bundle protein [Rhodanobacteraceae bacterium]